MSAFQRGYHYFHFVFYYCWYFYVQLSLERLHKFHGITLLYKDFGIQQVISTDGNFATCVFAVDFDNDGDIDILSSSVGDNEISWYKNIASSSQFV